ncbi:signal peptidase I, partial [Microbacterium sp.]|uniref:signal peptidase I n=1 Tax=Microbacterium sp. TaxID=51671 RepID=UPI003A8B5FBF
MTAWRWRDVMRTVTLSTGAIAGVVCVLWTLGLWALGLHPLVFLSGSMSPAIEAGAVGFARTVPADDIRVGDIVSVVTDEGVRVTHRVVSTVTDDAGPTFRLKGDANNTPDAHAYTLDTVDLVVGHVNGAGYVLQGVASPWGMAVGAGLLAACLVFGVRRRSDEPRTGGGAPGDQSPADLARQAVGDSGAEAGGRRPVSSRTSRVAAVALVPLVLAGAAAAPTAGTLAYFSDSAKLS